jgi:hypothetical protein
MSFRPSKWAGVLPGLLWFDPHRKALMELIARPGVKVLMAVNPQEDDPKHEIYGFLIHGVYSGREYAMPVVHYAYVKEAFRRSGIMQYLFTTAGIQLDVQFGVSHRTEDWDEITRHWRSVGRRVSATHDPRFARGSQGKDTKGNGNVRQL